MRLRESCSVRRVPRLPCGDNGSQVRRHTPGKAEIASALLLMALSTPVRAQQASQPGFDPGQAEKHFDQKQSEAAEAHRSALRMPRLSGQQVTADTKPMFILRGVSLSGVSAIPSDQIVEVYRSYLGKKVSQADLAAIAEGVSDLYRKAGLHLSRAIVPPQDIRSGRVRIQIIEGSITDVRLEGDDAGQFGVRPLLAPVLAEHPSRLATLERQLLLINSRAGVRIADTALEEIGTATGISAWLSR